jgi:hypothetical protein
MAHSYAMSRAALFREIAEKSKRKAAEARDGALRRSWLIVTREWLAMAEREETKEPPAEKVGPVAAEKT